MCGATRRNKLCSGLFHCQAMKANFVDVCILCKSKNVFHLWYCLDSGLYNTQVGLHQPMRSFPPSVQIVLKEKKIGVPFYVWTADIFRIRRGHLPPWISSNLLTLHCLPSPPLPPFRNSLLHWQITWFAPLSSPILMTYPWIFSCKGNTGSYHS